MLGPVIGGFFKNKFGKRAAPAPAPVYKDRWECVQDQMRSYLQTLESHKTRGVETPSYMTIAKTLIGIIEQTGCVYAAGREELSLEIIRAIDLHNGVVSGAITQVHENGGYTMRRGATIPGPTPANYHAQLARRGVPEEVIEAFNTTLADAKVMLGVEALGPEKNL